MIGRILVVDDLQENTLLLSLKMEAEYYDVNAAHDGLEALRLAADWQPDLILLDVMMPVMDGYETCRRLKADRRTTHIPVIMITALDGAAERLRGLECGADDFLTKPVDHDTLLARLRSLVRLKRLLDEWHARGDTTRALGLAAGAEPSVEGACALVVDDWDIGAAKVRRALASEGVSTCVARGEAEALEASAGVAFDLLIISLAVRPDDPLRLASKLRAADATREVPMLLIAEPDQRGALVRGFDLGANDWLTRPFDANELRLRARNQIRRKLYQGRLRADIDRALEMALTDPLTGLHNRRYVLCHLDNLLNGSRFRTLAVMMIDLDHFKRVNDRFGHAAGDHALELVTRVLRRETRAVDLVARYGGEEFIVVMPATNRREATTAGERLRAAIQSLEFRPGAGASCPLTASIGIAVVPCGGRVTRDALMKRADDALYAVKRNGRNGIEVFCDGA